MKKLKIFQLSLICLFLIFLFFFFKASNYTKEYTIEDIKITEEYRKDTKNYIFTFETTDATFQYIVNSNYKHERQFIKEIETIKADTGYCLIPSGDTFDFIPLCLDNNSIVHFSKVNSSLQELLPQEYQKDTEKLLKTYEDINIYNDDYTYFLWDYDGFYFINAEETKKIDLFSTELYNINLVAYTDDYLVIPDYDSTYTFNKFYRLAYEDGKVKELNLDYNIYFDSYFPGYEKNNLYIVDNKEEVMYELNVKNGEIDKIKPQLLENEQWQEVGIKTLVNQDKSFTYPSNYEYIFEDKQLSFCYPNEKISTFIDDDVTSIVRITSNEIFYLKTDTLYVFNILTGSTKLLNYFEWNFNYNNMIFVN